MPRVRTTWISSTALVGALAGKVLILASPAFANCTTVGSTTTCTTAAPNPWTTRVGTGKLDNNRTVTIDTGATINTTNTNAISIGDGGTINISGSVQNTANTGGGNGLFGTGNNTIEFNSNGTLTIATGGSIIKSGTSTNSEAINIHGFGNRIENRGLIRATNSSAIWFEDQVTGAKNTVDNYGTIEKVGGGAVMGSSGTSGIIFSNRTGATISGDLTFSGGNDDLFFYAGSVATGSINGGGGTNNLTLQGDAGSNDSLPGSIANFSTLTKDGAGHWTVSGSLSGFTIVTVKNGVLTLTGNNAGYTGNLVVDPTGTLEARAQSLPTKTPAANNVNNVQNNGLVRFTQSDDGSYGGQITGTGLVEKTGAGVLTLAPVVAAGNTFAGGLFLNQGVVAVAADNALGAAAGGLTFNGGTLRLNSSFNLGAGRAVTLNAGGGTIDTQAFTSTLSQVMTGAGAFTKAGSGTLTLTGANSYAGATTVAAGSLIVNGNQSAATGLTTVNSGGTLGGFGTIGGNVFVANGGALAPGNVGTTPGTLTINGNLGLNATSSLNYNFGQANVVGGAFNDLTRVNGNLTLDGSLNVALTPGGTFNPGIYRVISYGGTLTNNTMDIGTLPPGTPPGTFFVQTSVANQVNLVNTAGLSLNFWDGAAGPKNNGAVNGGNGTWQNTSGNDNWTDQTGALNAPYANGAFAIFMATPGTVTVDNSLGAVTASGLQFASDGYVISGGALTLVGAPTSTIRVGDGTTAGASFVATINSVLTGSTQLAKTDLGTLVLNGANTYTGGTAINGGTVQVSSNSNLGAAAGVLAFDGGTLRTTADITMNRATTLNAGGGIFETATATQVTQQGDMSGTGALTKIGAGTLTVTGTGSYTGGTTITAGTLQLGNGGTTGSIVGDVINNAALVVNRSNALSLGGVISGTGQLQQIGLGITTLTGTNTYTGGTTIAAGTLQLGNGGTSGSIVGNVTDNGTLAFNRSDTTTFGGVISGTGQLQQIGSGITTLTGTNSYAGATTVAAGSLIINGDQTAATGLTTVNSGATLGGTGIIGGNVTVANGGTLAPGAVGTAPGTLTINGDLGLNNTSNLNYQFGQANVAGGAFNDLTRVNGNLTLDGTLNVTQAPGGTFDPGIYRIISYGGSLTNNTLDIGTLPPGTPPGTFFVQTSVANQVNLVNTAGLSLNFWDGAAGPKNNGVVNGGNGTWQNTTGNDNWTDQTGALNAPYANGAFAIFMATPGAVTVDNSLGAVTASGLQFASDGYVIGGGALTLTGGATSIIKVGDGSAAGASFTATINSVLAGATQLVKTDLGTLVLNGTNTYTGGTAINGGVVQVSSNSNLGLAAGGLAFDGGTLHTTADITMNRATTLNAGGGTVNIDAGTQLTQQGDVSGAGGLTKTGAGALTLTGTGAYTGGTTITAGTLQLGNGGATGAIVGNVTNNGTLITNRSNALSLDGVISGSGQLQQIGLGTTTLTGANTYTGGTTISAGTLQLGNGGASGAIVGDVTNNGTLAFNRSDATTFGGVISGTGQVQQLGAGTTTLTGTNTYTGGTTITAGTLQLGNGGTAGSIPGNVLNNGTFAFNRSDDVSFSGLISGSGALRQIGAGTTTLTGTNSYAGATSVEAGSLIVNGDQSAATGATTVNSGATLGGTGIIGGSVTVADGGTLSPGAVGTTPGTLTINGNLGLNDASNLNYSFGQANVAGGAFNDLTRVNGNLTLDGKVNVALTPGGTFDPGIYRVISYGGTLTNNTLEIGTLPSGVSPGTFFVQTSVANQVNLVNTAGLNLNFWDGNAGPKNDGAVNGGNGIWQNASGNDNWTEQSGSINAPYANGAFAIFMAAPGTVTVDNSLGAVTASGMQFASDGYIITGGTLTLVGAPTSIIKVGDGTAAGASFIATINSVLDGTTQLVKTDLGTLVLNGTNTYTGGTAFNGGTVQISSDGNLGAASGGLAFDGGTLRSTADIAMNRATTLNAGGGIFETATGTQLTQQGDISGAGGLTKIGAGTLALTGTGTYTGGTTITAGTLQLGNGGSTGSITGDITNNATLAFNRSDDASFGGVISGSGVLRQIGAGSTTLTGTNTYTGATSVEAGALFVNGNQSTATGLTTVNSGATLGGTGIIGGSVTIANGGTLAPGALGATPGTLTINGNLGLNATSNLNYSLGQANAAGGAFNDLTTVNGNLTLDGALNVALAPGGAFDPGVYRIINYSGSLTNNTLDIGALPPGTLPGTFLVQTSIANQVNLVNTAGLNLNFWDGAAGPKNNGTVNGGNGTWQNGSGNDNWTEQTGQVNAPYANGAFAIFMATAGTVTVDNSLGAVTASGLQFASNGYVITGDVLTLTGGASSIIKVGDGTIAGASFVATINSELAGNTQLNKTDLGTLVLTGTNTYTGGTMITAGTLQLGNGGTTGSILGDVTNNGTLAFNRSDAVSFDGTISGTGQLQQLGSGTTTLTATNTYNGGTTITAGTLQLGNGGTTGSIVGNVTNNGTLAFNRSDAVAFDGAISGTGQVQQLGGGVTTFTGTNTYTGGTTIAAGTLQLGNGGTAGSIVGNVINNGTLAFNRSDDVSFTGLISGSGELQQIGSGTTTLTGTNSYTGATTVQSGALIVNGNQSAATGLTTVNGGATLGGTGTIGGDVTIANGGTLAPGAVGAAPGTLTINGALGLNDTSNLNYHFGQANVAGGAFNDLTSVNGNLTLDGKLNVDLAAGGAFDAGVYRVISYAGTLTNNTLDIGTLPPGTPPGTFLVQTSVANQVNLVNTAGLNLNFWDGNAGPKNDGVLNGGNGTWQNASGNDNWTEQTGTTNAPYANGAFAIFMATPGTVTIDNSLGAVTASGMQFASNGYVITGDTLTLVGATTSTIRVGDGSSAGASFIATINAVLAGTTQLVKTDLGTLVLNGTNIYTGGTAINGGTVQISNDNNLGAATGGLAFNGGTLHTTADITTNRTTTLNAGGGTFNTDAGTQLTQQGDVSGAGGLTKTGAGALTLTGTGTYTGGTTITAGTLQLGNGGTTGSIAGNVINNATLAVNRSDTATLSGAISGTGQLQQLGTGTTTLTGTNTYTGGTTISAGTLQLGNGGATGSIVGNVTNNGTLAFNRSDAMNFGGQISGSGGIRQIGTGTTTLAAASTYSGPTSVEAGTLAAGGTNVFSPGSAFSTLSGGTLDLHSFDQRLASLSNAGTVSLGGLPGTILTVTGNYIGAGGTLRLNTVLGDDNSKSDRLVVQGNTSGASTLQVTNVGGTGAPTVEGIKVIDITGASGGTFTLAGNYVFNGAPAVIGGAYAYQLYKNGVSTPTDGDWYLRSALLPQGPPSPIYQPGVPLYEVFAQALLVLNDLPTLQQRVGNRYWDTPQGAWTPQGAPVEAQGIWARIETAHGHFAPRTSTSGADYNFDTWQLKAGLDGQLYESARGRLISGLTAHYGDVSANVSSIFGDGKIRAKGYGVGGTLTWYGQSGFYIDGQAQATWFDSALFSTTLNRNLVDGNKGFGYALSVEAGQRIGLTRNWTLTPQAQLIYSAVSFDRFTDPFGASVSLDRGDSLKSRLGISADYGNAWKDATGKTVRTLVYGIANVSYEFRGDTQVSVSGVKVASAVDRLQGGVGLGGSYSWREGKYTVYGEGTINTGLAHFGDSYLLKGSLGFRASW